MLRIFTGDATGEAGSSSPVASRGRRSGFRNVPGAAGGVAAGLGHVDIGQPDRRSTQNVSGAWPTANANRTSVFERFVALGDYDDSMLGPEDLYPDGRGYRGLGRPSRSSGLPPKPRRRLREPGGPRLQGTARSVASSSSLRSRSEPDLASILGGINDVLRRRLDLDRVVGDLDAMAAALSAQGATVLTFTFPDPTAVITVAAARIRARVASSTPASGRCPLPAAPSSSTSSTTASPIPRSGARIASTPTASATHGWRPPRRPRSGSGSRDGGWALPLPPPPPRRALARYGSDAVWMGRHMAPWLLRRLRGVSSGDGRSAKRPELLPVAAAVPSDEPG